MAQILADLDDINSHLDGTSVVADDIDTNLIQISVARTVRGYLSRILPVATLAGWSTPTSTPEIIREIAGMLIAAQLYANKTSGQTRTIDERHFAQLLYDRAIAMLNQIILGEIVIPDIPPVSPVEALSELDFFPVDNTDRAFSMAMRLD